MKFGSQLKEAIYPGWQHAYLDYDGLKKKLQKADKDNPFSERDETEFVEQLDSNLEMVYAFHQEKVDDIRTRTDHWAETIGTTRTTTITVDELGRIQETINAIADDINQLARYSRVNYTGFLKIVKKHDRHTNYVLRPMFMVRLNQCPFWNDKNDALLVKLSQLFAQVRQGGKTMSFQHPTRQNEPISTLDQHQQQQQQKVVVRRFFVKKDNVLELKTFVLRHLPVLVYQDNTTSGTIDPPISTLYLDNSDLDTYNSRVEKAPGSQIVRLRWYGSAHCNSSIAFERRTLAEESCGELKDRFVIKDKYISDFLHGGQAYINKYSQKLQAMASKSDKDIVSFQTLVNQVQQTLLNQRLQPVLRTYYKRTVFQIPGDKTVRMALDTDVCFIREDGRLFDQINRRPGNAWRRPDADIQFPFPALFQANGEIHHLPFTTFEIKMDLAPGQAEPEWIKDLQETGLVEQVVDFCKFVHGMAVMFDTRVALLPYWLAQMDDPPHELPELPSVDKKQQQEGQQTIPANDDYPMVTRSIDETTPLLTQPISPDSSSSSSSSSSSWYITLRQLFLFFGPHHPTDDALPVLPFGVKIPKKVITPLRVEPKVFFANERTFFAWMSFGTLLATFSVALFNAGDAVGKVSGVVYTLVSLSTLLYGMGLYYRRHDLICQRASGPYDDMAGATVICIALLSAVGLNAYLKLTVKSPSLLSFY